MAIIRQTNRSILFEEINPEKNNLLTLLSDNTSQLSLNDDKVKEINQNLLMKNFEEFMEKFSPVVYALYDATHNKMRYFLEKPNVREDLIRRVEVNRDNDFVKMFLDLPDEGKGKKNKIVHFERMLDFMLPYKRMEEIKKIQTKFLELYQTYVTCPDENSKKKEKLYSTMSALLESDMTKYTDVMSLLPIAMEDMRKKLFPKKKISKIWNPITAGVAVMEEQDVHILDIPELGDVRVSDLDAKFKNSLREMIVEHYRQGTDVSDLYIEHLLLRSYGLEVTEGEDGDFETMVVQYNQYLDFYLDANKEFIKTVKPLLEKILGIKAYFDQYETEKTGMGMELLITNVKNELWIDIRKTERLTAYLNTVNSKIDYENTIWFAIIPNLTFPPEKVKSLSRERFKGNTERHVYRTNSITLAGNIMAITFPFGIQTFFSFECDESTTFSYTREYGVEHFREGCKPFMRKDYSEYAIPCFPNFTMIPKEKSYLMVGTKLLVTEENRVMTSPERKDICQLWLGGIHLEAAYVAAGLTASWQCPNYLRERYPKETGEDLPGVRYDPETDQHMLHTVTTMGKEITGYEEEVLQDTAYQPFGFFFSSETRYRGKKMISNVMVQSARNLSLVNNRFDPIFKLLTINYIERVFRYDTFDYKKTEIIRFFQNHPNGRRTLWQTNRKQINAILREEDHLGYRLDEKNDLCILEVTFGEDTRQRVIGMSSPLTEEGEG